MMYQVTTVTAKDELIRLLEDGWDFVKELSDGEYGVRKNSHVHMS